MNYERETKIRIVSIWTKTKENSDYLQDAFSDRTIINTSVFNQQRFIVIKKLRNKGSSGSRLVLPGWWKLTLSLVVSSQTVDTGLDENESVLAIDVLAGSLKMLADSNSLLDEMVEILWELWSHSLKTGV